MPCEVCGAYPTWADLDECGRPTCPWTLDMWKPVPLLADMHRHPPSLKPVPTPVPVSVQNKPKPILPATISDMPQPHSFGASLDQRMLGMTPTAIVVDEPPKLSFAQMVAQKPAPMQPLAKPPVPKPTAKPPTPKPEIKLTKTASEDYDLIMQAVDKMNWSGSFGPSCQVKSKLRWTDLEGRALYLAVKEDLHDKAFSVGNKTLYYYITSLAPKLKAGFRITGHSKRSDSVGKSKTHGVLHIEN